jgi:hypothetical protein
MLSRFQDPERLVEFQCQLDLCVTEQGEGGIHLFIPGFLELVPAVITATVQDFNKDAFPGLENERTGQGLGGDAGNAGEFFPVQLVQETLNRHAFSDFTKSAPRELHYV